MHIEDHLKQLKKAVADNDFELVQVETTELLLLIKERNSLKHIKKPYRVSGRNAVFGKIAIQEIKDFVIIFQIKKEICIFCRIYLSNIYYGKFLQRSAKMKEKKENKIIGSVRL